MDAPKEHGGCCGSHAKGAEQSHDHGHSHGHEHSQPVSSQAQGHDHGHAHDHGSAEEEEKPRVKIVREVPPPDDEPCCSAPGSKCCTLNEFKLVSKEHSHGDDMCDACDPMSAIAHTIRVTRIRIANLCCSGEEVIIRTVLDGFHGIEHVAINIVGRYAVVKHCGTSCCAPIDRMIDALNEKYLGASIQEVGADEENEEKPFNVYGHQAIHVCIVGILFVIALIVDLSSEADLAAMWIYIVSTIVGILPIIQSTGITLFVRHSIDIHVLMLIAIVGAMASQDFFDSSLVVTLFSAAELIEQVVMFRVRRAVKMSSAASAPSKVALADGSMVLVEELNVDMVCAVRTGEMILADGVVVKGEGVVDESALTGESLPVKKTLHSEVRSGTVVQNGYMEYRVTKASAESTMQKLCQEVADVQADRGEYAQIVDRFALYWTPFILVAAGLFVIISGSVTTNWDDALYRGLLLLVLACPCAIVISAPIPAVCAIATAARHGVLIRGSSVVERMGLVDSVALDKTGTLTRGFFKVVDKLVLAETAELAEGAMACAAAIEEKSSHPLASAIVSEFLGCIAEGEKSLPPIRKVQVIEGVGVSGWAQINGVWKYCEIGNERILEKHGGTAYATKAQLARIESFIQEAGSTVCLLVAVDDDVMLVISLMDQVRPESVQFVSILQKQLGFKVSMLTGDTELVARYISDIVGIPPESCFYRLLPADKMHWIRAQQHMTVEEATYSPMAPTHAHHASIDVVINDTTAGEAGFGVRKSRKNSGSATINAAPQREFASDPKPHHVLMVGDGINDSTALACAAVGVAMGAGGSAMAVTAADVVLMTENLLMIPAAVQMCQAARAAMIQNCTFALGIKVVAIVLAVLGYLKFWHAILIDLGSLLIVVLNGTKLLQYRVFEPATSRSTSSDDVTSTAGGSSAATYNPIQQV